MSRLLQKEQGNDSSNSEQINKKLEILESIALKLLEKEPLVIHGGTEEVKIKKKIDEPEIEELEETFIPSIDTSKMKMKGSSSKTKTTSNKMDIDDSVDLLSRIIGQED
jgi:selenocysteine-specific translation elongation factor